MGDTDDIFSKVKKKENKINKREVYRQYTFGGSVTRQMSFKEIGRSETIELGYDQVSQSRENRRKKMVYRYYQQVIHNFLDRPSEGTLGRFSTTYHFMSIILVVACLCLTVFSTMEGHSELEHILNRIENMMIAQFFIEYILRVWSCGSRTRYRGTRGRLRYCCRIFSLLDLVVIIVGFSMMFAGRSDDSSRSLSATSTLRSVRFLQIARVFRLDRCGTSWKLLRSVFVNHAKELLSAIYLGSLTLVFSSFMIFRIENGLPQYQNGTDPFATFGDALWWGVSTFSTIGYGDRVPSTGMGKFISSIFSIIGICFFALPAGILGTGFALKVQEQHRVKHNVKRRIPAARLIQTLWKIHVAEQEMLRRFQRSKTGSFSRKKMKKVDIHERVQELEPIKGSAFIQGFAGIISSITQRQDEDEIGNDEVVEALKNSSAEARVAAITFITKVKFFVARKQFREAQRPYDITDVIEQYSKGYLLVHDSVKQVRAGNDDINLELQAIREKMSLMMSKMDRLLLEQKNSAETLAQLKIEQNLGMAKCKRRNQLQSLPSSDSSPE